MQDGKSGFHIDPYHGEEAADKMAAFFERCQEEKDFWDHISQGEHLEMLVRCWWWPASQCSYYIVPLLGAEMRTSDALRAHPDMRHVQADCSAFTSATPGRSTPRG